MSSLSDFIGAGGAKVWVSGSTVKQWQYVISPLDGELYQRITATGAGTTDPADDVTNYYAASYERIVALPNISSYFAPSGAFAVYASNLPRVTPGAIAAGTRTLVYQQTGRGSVDFLGLYIGNASRTDRWEVLIDGRTVFDKAPSTFNGGSMTVVGDTSSDGTNALGRGSRGSDVKFRRAFQVYLTPSAAYVSGTGGLVVSARSEG